MTQYTQHTQHIHHNTLHLYGFCKGYFKCSAPPAICMVRGGTSEHTDILEEDLLPTVHIVWLPFGTTSNYQPMDQGIIWAWKAHYRRSMMRHIIHYAEAHPNENPWVYQPITYMPPVGVLTPGKLESKLQLWSTVFQRVKSRFMDPSCLTSIQRLMICHKPRNPCVSSTIANPSIPGPVPQIRLGRWVLPTQAQKNLICTALAAMASLWCT